MYPQIDEITSKLNRITTLCEKGKHFSPYRRGKLNNMAAFLRDVAQTQFVLRKLKPEDLSSVFQTTQKLDKILKRKKTAISLKAYDDLLELHRRANIEMLEILSRQGIDTKARYFSRDGVIYELSRLSEDS